MSIAWKKCQVTTFIYAIIFIRIINILHFKKWCTAHFQKNVPIIIERIKYLNWKDIFRANTYHIFLELSRNIAFHNKL